MTWTAPKVERVEPQTIGGERELLDQYLEFHRQTFLWKCSGLTGEQLAGRVIPASTMSLLGLIRHLSDVERSWFRIRMSKADVPLRYWTDDWPDADFDDLAATNAEADYEAYVNELDACRDAVANRDLDDIFTHPRTGESISVRWLMLHLVEEYARHNGHADLLRQTIDGEVGE
jgi:hypothetical protein